MTLKVKTLAIVAATFVCLAVGTLTGAWFFLYKNLTDTEAQLTR